MMDSYPIDKKRLIVVIPGCLANNFDIAHKIYTLASRIDADILYLILAKDKIDMLDISQHMETMRTITKGTWVIVVSDIANVFHWSRWLQEVCHSYDLVIRIRDKTDMNVTPTLAARFLQDPHNISAPLSQNSPYPQPVTVQHPTDKFAWFGFLTLLATFALLGTRISGRNHHSAVKHIN
jgi:hypothetical protein